MTDGLQQAINRALAKEEALKDKRFLGICDECTVSVESATQLKIHKQLAHTPKKYIFRLQAVSKPRMTQRDKWEKRETVQRYWSYKDELKRAAKDLRFNPQYVLENYYHLVFYLPMPESWSSVDKVRKNNEFHRQKPDKDNLEKGFLDALCNDDSFVADSRVTKYWCYKGQERIEVILP